MKPKQAHGNGTPAISPPLMKQFFIEHPGPLLPVFLKEGVEAFGRAFCDVYHTHSSSAVRIVPEDVIPTFKGYFHDHFSFFEIAKEVHDEEFAGESVNKTNVDSLLQMIYQSEGFKKIEKSSILPEEQRRIICLSIPTTKEKKTSGKVIPGLFQGVNLDDLDDVDGVDGVVKKSPTKKTWSRSNPSTPEREKALNVIREEIVGICSKTTVLGLVGQSPTNPEIRARIETEHPELKDWLTIIDNHQWISKKLSQACKKAGLLTNYKSTGAAANIKAPKEKLPPEKLKVKKLVGKVQGKPARNPKFYNIREFEPMLLEKYPELTDWITENVHRRYVQNQLATATYNAKHGKQTDPVAKDDVKSVPPVRPAPQVKPAKLAQPSPQVEDILDIMALLLKDMSSGTVPPVDIIRRGNEISAQKADFQAKLTELSDAIDEKLAAYRALGIEV